VLGITQVPVRGYILTRGREEEPRQEFNEFWKEDEI
jgi:hypothetical protein